MPVKAHLNSHHDYSSIPVSNRGQVISSRVEGNSFKLSCKLNEPVDDLAAVIFYDDGTWECHEAWLDSASGEHRAELPFTTSDIPVLAIDLVVWADGRVERIAQGLYAYLTRILNRDMKAINDNLRWGGRIQDLSTRTFACINSIRVCRDDFRLVNYCTVACGYGLIEADDAANLQRLLAVAEPILTAPDATTKGVAELTSSTIFLQHVAIFLQDRARFEALSERVLASLPRLEEDPMSIYNALRSMLLCAGYAYHRNMPELRTRFTHDLDNILRLAGSRYPLFLQNLLEISDMYRTGLILRIIQGLGDGASMPSDMRTGYYSAEPMSVWRHGGRIKDRNPSFQEMATKFSSLCLRET